MDSRVKEVLKRSEKVVFFGGAGLYKAMNDYGYSPEHMLSRTFFMNHTEKFYDYYKKNLIYPDAQPNKAHIALAELESEGKLTAVVTQNIDGLHQKAGSKTVYELHGSVLRNVCMECGAKYDLDYIMDEEHCHNGMPHCEKCNGLVKPDVVLYEEPLDDDVIKGAVKAISEADTMIVGGTSLVVYPAAGLINYFRGKDLMLINKSETGYDSQATLVINDSIGKVLGE